MGSSTRRMKKMRSRVERGSETFAVRSSQHSRGAAWHLSCCKGIEVTVLEAAERTGGHANTIDLKLPEGEVSVDTGFMVFNDHNYPNMVRLFDELCVANENTDMSFSVSLDERTQEWGSKSLFSLFARKRNIFCKEFHKMLSEMARFNREAPRLLLMEDDDPRKAVSVREYLKTNGYSEAFARLYLVPMAAALWSSTTADVMAHSALALISFFHNHMMLQILGRPQWKTPASRSRQYVREICRRIGEDRIELGNACVRVERVSSPAKGAANGLDGKHKSVTNGNGQPHAEKAGRSRGGVGKEGTAWKVTDIKGKPRVFDEVIFACPADKALGFLGEEASSGEKDALSRFKFSDNTIYVHSDEKLMPRRRAAWSSWNYLGKSLEIDTASAKGSLAETKPVFVTYWLNQLQNLTIPRQVFLTLNPHTPPESSLTHKVMKYRHPQFSPQAEAGQRILSRDLDGRRGLWFCGAWRGYGFHEDGLRSGLEAATSITGTPVPWVRGLSSPSPELQNASNSAPPATVTRDATNGHGPVAKQGLLFSQPQVTVPKEAFGRRVAGWVKALVEAVAVRAIAAFLRRTVVKGCLRVTYPDGRVCVFGDADSPGVEDDDGTAKHGGRIVSLKVYDWWFFVRVALEYDLGLARSYLAGEWELIGDNQEHDGLRQFFLFLIDNRDVSKDGKRGGMKARKLVTSWVGYAFNFLLYKLNMDNSVSGARSNIAAHYDLSNELFKLFLDKRHILYSCGIFHTEMQSPTSELLLTGSIEDAQGRKADALIRRLRLSKHHYLLDIGFGWGGICIRAAETIGCRVHGITISKEQKALAEERVIARGLQHLITFELVDYRDFAKRHKGEFDRIVSCEMIEAVGHNYLGAFFAASDALLAPDGIMVMQAITTPENRYEEYIKSTDFINTIIFPGSCCPSLNALLEAMATHSEFSLEGLDNIGIHYARTLKEWRHRFNHRRDEVIAQGFDSAFIRCFNYYFTYCEAGFASRTEACLMLTFSRPGCAALDPNALISALAR